MGTSIRPGYIVFQNDQYLMRNYPNVGTMHEKLFLDFTGKTVNELAAENVKYLGWGFSYQRDNCQFVFKSGTFNGDRYSTLPDGSEIPVREAQGSIRRIPKPSENLIRFAFQRCIGDGTRVFSASEIMSYSTHRFFRGYFPVCPSRGD